MKVINALQEFPQFNAALVGEGKIMLRKYFNIGIAVDTKDGLLVPVIKEADQFKYYMRLPMKLLCWQKRLKIKNCLKRI